MIYLIKLVKNSISQMQDIRDPSDFQESDLDEARAVYYTI